MKKNLEALVCLFFIILIAAGCTTASNAGRSVQEFFGFNRPTHTPEPVFTEQNLQPEQKAQDKAKPDEDPFGTSKSPESGTAVYDSDKIDPALIEPDSSETEAKNSEEENWEEDPYAYSFSPSSFYYDEQEEVQEKRGGPEMQNPPMPPIHEQNPPMQDQNLPVPPRNPQRSGTGDQQMSYTFYYLRDNPVFRPMCELPRTGFPTGFITEIKKNVSYAKTNMSISIPTLNVEENIVIVPLVDDHFPVEELGENIGLLEGSGPGKDDLFVLAAHNHLNTQEQGPFAKLSAMKESDLIFISGANNSSRTFVVYANEKFASDDIDGLVSFAKPGCMILITCEDESIEGGYLNRRVVFAEAKED